MNTNSFIRWALCILVWAAAATAAMAKDKEAPPPVPWTVKPDLPAPSTGPASRPTTSSAPADANRLKPNIAMSLPLKSDRELLVPSRPSRFVLAISRWEDGWELWDLGSGTRPCNGSGRIDMDDKILSPDGQYLAGTRRDKDAKTSAVEIWWPKTLKRAGRIEGLPDFFAPKAIGFAGNDRILVLHWSAGGERFVRVYDIASGDQKAEFKVGDNRFLFSPSGAYVILVGREQLEFVNTATGQLCGTIALTDWERGGEHMSKSDLADIAFSPTGKEMALLYMQSSYFARAGQTRIVIHDVVSGAKKGEFAFEVPGDRDKARKGLFEYLPDGSGWLVHGDTIVDRTAAAAIYTFPKMGEVLFARMITPEQVLEIIKTDKSMVFQTRNMPKDTASKAVAALREGNKIEDGNLPPLTKCTPDGAQAIAFEGVPPTPWAVKPVDLGPTTRPLQPSISIKTLAKPDASGRREDEPTALLFTSREANSAIVEHATPDHSERGGQFHRSGAWICRVDLSSGFTLTEMDVPSLMQLQDVSPTGNSLLCRTGSELARVDVMSLEKGRYKPSAAFRPYDAESVDPKVIGSAAKAVRTVESAVLIDDAHVMTISGSGVLMLWELPACRAIWRANVPLSDTGVSCRPALSPDRKLGAVPIKDGLIIFETLTGKPLNSLPQDTAPAKVSAIAFSPEGRRLAAILSQRGAIRLQVYDLASGTMTTEVPLPNDMGNRGDPRISGQSAIQFPSPGYVLVGPYLISLERKLILWQYSTGPSPFGTSVRVGPVVPFEGAWFLAPKDTRAPMSLVHVALPHEAARKALAKLDGQDLYTWAPGMKVSVNVSVVGDEEFRKQELARWVKELKAMGFDVVDGAPNVLTASTSLANAGAQRYNGPKGGYTRTYWQTAWSIRLVAGGKEIWKDESAPVTPREDLGPIIEYLTIREGETAQQASDREHPMPKSASQVFLPPAYIFKERQIDLTKVGYRGLEDVQTPTPGPRPPGQ